MKMEESWGGGLCRGNIFFNYYYYCKKYKYNNININNNNDNLTKVGL